MKFNSNNEYYISLLFFLIIHAKLITSAKIKILGVPQDLNITKDHINKSNEITSLEEESSIKFGKDELDMFNKTNVQGSFLEIKSNLDEEKNLKRSPSNDIELSDDNEINPGSNKKNFFITNIKPIKHKISNSSFYKQVPEDKLVLKLKELEEKFKENYQVEERINLATRFSSPILKRNSKMKSKNSLVDLNKSQTEYYEEGNDFMDDLNIEEFLNIKSEKRKYLEDHNVFMFYNSLSLVMLSMLGGGVIGIIFILYFSYKDENHKL